MGYNTTVVILNDALSYIEGDPEFGKKLANGIRNVNASHERQDVSAGNHCNAALVVETHHADNQVPVLVGGNTAIVVEGMFISWAPNPKDMELDLLKELAAKLGYQVSKKRVRKKVA